MYSWSHPQPLDNALWGSDHKYSQSLRQGPWREWLAQHFGHFQSTAVLVPGRAMLFWKENERFLLLLHMSTQKQQHKWWTWLCWFFHVWWPISLHWCGIWNWGELVCGDNHLQWKLSLDHPVYKNIHSISQSTQRMYCCKWWLLGNGLCMKDGMALNNTVKPAVLAVQ